MKPPMELLLVLSLFELGLASRLDWNIPEGFRGRWIRVDQWDYTKSNLVTEEPEEGVLWADGDEERIA